MFSLRPQNRRRRATQPARWSLPVIPWAALGRWALAAGSVAAVLLVTIWALNQPVSTVSVAGRFERVAPMDVERAVKESAAGKGLVSVDLAKVRAAVRALPWVDTVSVQRNWPRGLAVTIGEQVAAARWGDHGLLNTRGDLFANDATHIPPELPRLSGPDGTQASVVQRYFTMRDRLLEAGMRITALRLDARGAWQLDLDNGVTVRLGRQRLDERFNTFMATAARIVAQRAADIAYVDMRYANGFAIGWRGAGTGDAKNGGDARNV
ncbi:MAG TPA: cell division protein FtsQ/DivIB [Steroidobacteraceae bacterium]|jgi:cell division protein FtsQ|nr:cell division protein FtsQ/DivIB [Steroidobacteraceae bacterium]